MRIDCNSKKIRIGLLLLLLAAVAFCAYGVWWGKQNGMLVPAWVQWQEKELEATQDGDGKVLNISLKHKQMSVADESGRELFKTDKSIKVQDVLCIDIDGDGAKDIIAITWKRGKFGKHRPFWITEDEKSYSQHIFIYTIRGDGTVAQKWFASDIGMLVKRMKLLDPDGDRKILLCEDIGGKCSLWLWESFGLKSMDNEVKFVAFGDNIIHDAIMEHADIFEGGSYDFLYDDFRKEIESADIAAVNAETVLVENETMVSGYPSFGSPVAAGQALVKAGFDVAVCGNNHVLDKGIGALDYTHSFYTDSGLKCVGIQNSTDEDYRPCEFISRNGIRFALFSYTYGTNVGDASKKYPNAIHYLPKDAEGERRLVEEMRSVRGQGATNESPAEVISGDADSARDFRNEENNIVGAEKPADFVVVFVHWGDEYSVQISEEQRHFASLFAEGGADVVIGTHPHVVQETEKVQRPDGGEMVVFYSLGNFVADQGRSAETKEGAEAIFTVAHTYDGAALTGFETRKLNSYWKR